MIVIPSDILFSSSYVLSFCIEPYIVWLDMEFALTPEHPEYSLPDADKQECYRRGAIGIRGFERVTWSATGFLPSHDAKGEVDFGNLDEFTYTRNVWRLAGDWGLIEVLGGKLQLDIA